MSSTIFVTGATGQTGGNVCEQLIQRGDQVRALVRNPDEASALSDIGVELVKGDIRDADDVLRAANVGKQTHEIDAETTPLREPENYQFDIDLPEVAEVWRRGSVIASWLLDLTAASLASDPELKKFEGHVSDSGEGRWTIKAGIDEGVPIPVLTTALYERFSSRGNAEFQNKLLSAMRYQFGGHVEKAK